MSSHAILYNSDKLPLKGVELVTHGCLKAGFQVETCNNHPKLGDVKSSLPLKPVLILIPTSEEDCHSVKLAQEISDTGHVVVCYDNQLPSKEYLCLGYREGISDFIALEAGQEAVVAQIRRAGKILDQHDSTSGMDRELKRLLSLTQQLEETNARWEERMLALASTAERMASGQMKVSQRNPILQIVVSSSSQAGRAKSAAEKIGFTVRICESGQIGVADLQECKPDVILTDGTLQDMSGSEYALAARKELGNHPVIVIAWSSDPDIERSLLVPETGIDDFVAKGSGRTTEGLLAGALLGALR